MAHSVLACCCYHSFMKPIMTSLMQLAVLYTVYICSLSYIIYIYIYIFMSLCWHCIYLSQALLVCRQETQHLSNVSADAAARSASVTGAHAWQALLNQADQRASAMSHHYQTPVALLEDVVWAVTDPPEKARLDSLSASYAGGPECALLSWDASLITCTVFL